MESTNFSQDDPTIFSRLKPHFFSIFLTCVGLVLVGYGVIMYLDHQSASEDITFATGKESNVSVKNVETNIVVDVEGAVQKPGVYRLKPDSRVEDVIKAAGGYRTDVDKGQTQHSLNLAAKVTDGMKLYIPKIGESAGQTSVEVMNTSSAAVAGASVTGLVSINAASAEQLDSLPGVGKVTADKIITGRPYSSIDELVSKKIVGSSIFSKIKDKIGL